MSKKLSSSQKEVLLKAMERLDELQKKLGVEDEYVGDIYTLDDGGLPSENKEWSGMTYIEALYKAREMENDAIEINLLLLELAPEKDSKSFIEIANDENDHDKIYAKIIERIERGEGNE